MNDIKAGKLYEYVLFMIVGLILLTSLQGCPEKKTAEGAKRINVGILFPLTGDLADKGLDCSRGIDLAVEEINASGGIRSLSGARLATVYGDTCGRPENGVKEAERLIRGTGVVALIGTYQSSVTKPATQLAERLETPFIVSISIADIITERGFRYTFRIQPKAQFYGRDQVLFLKDLRKLAGYRVERVALIHENTDFGTAAALSQKKALHDYGLDLAAEVSYVAEGVSDLTKEVAQVLASRPDAIIETTYLHDSILIRRALHKAGSRIPLVDTAGGTVSPEYIKELGQEAEGTLTSSEFSKFTNEGRKLNDRFRKRFGFDITGDSAYAYQSVWVLKDALERAASTNREDLRQALAETSLPRGPHMVLPSDRIHFDPWGQNESARLFIVQIQRGELVPVWPPEYAAARVHLGK